jgi:hypothetical protein
VNCIAADKSLAGYGRYFRILFGGDARGVVMNCSVRGVSLGGDGVADYDEISYDGVPLLYTPGLDLDQLNPDTDGDGVSDGVELGCPGGAPLCDDASPYSFSVNFQPSDAARVTGILPDLGISFTPAHGYGWL